MFKKYGRQLGLLAVSILLVAGAFSATSVVAPAQVQGHSGDVVVTQACAPVGWTAVVSLANNVTMDRTVKVTTTIPGQTGITNGHYDTTHNSGDLVIWSKSGTTVTSGSVTLTITYTDHGQTVTEFTETKTLPTPSCPTLPAKPIITAVCQTSLQNPPDPPDSTYNEFNWYIVLPGVVKGYGMEFSTNGINWSSSIDWSSQNDPIAGGGWGGPMTTTTYADNGGDHLWVRWTDFPTVVTGPVVNDLGLCNKPTPPSDPVVNCGGTVAFTGVPEGWYLVIEPGDILVTKGFDAIQLNPGVYTYEWRDAKANDMVGGTFTIGVCPTPTPAPTCVSVGAAIAVQVTPPPCATPVATPPVTSTNGTSGPDSNSGFLPIALLVSLAFAGLGLLTIRTQRRSLQG